MPKILALDSGTSGFKAVAIDADTARILDSQYQPLKIYYPRNGFVEQDPEELLAALSSTVAELVTRVGNDFISIGITNQRESIVAWDIGTKRPISNIIVWQDKRGLQKCEELKKNSELADYIRNATGLVLDPYFSASKMSYLVESGALGTAETVVGTVDSFLIWYLTGGNFVTDVSNASRTLLFNISSLEYDKELIDVFNVSQVKLPEVLPSATTFGSVCNEFAATTKLRQGTPITAVLGDQQAALFGHRCFSPGLAKSTYGTGSFTLINLGSSPAVVPGLLTTIFWQKGKETYYALEGSNFVSGAAIDWAIDTLSLANSPKELSEICQTQMSETLFIPALSGLGSPWWKPEFKGVLRGLSASVTKNDIARSLFEGLAFQTKDILEAARAHSDRFKYARIYVDGGVTKSTSFLRILSDALNIRVLRPENEQVTSLGAGLLSALSAKYYCAIDDIEKLDIPQLEVSPNPNNLEYLAVKYEKWLNTLTGPTS